MPPAVPSEDESSGADIPFKKGKGKGKAALIAKAAQDDEDAEEEEFVVEKIITHRFEEDGTLKFQVKWQGYPSSDNTWEPEENLDGCPDEADEYYKAIGGKPNYNPPRAKASATKKRKLSEGPVSTPTPKSNESGRGRQKKSKKVDEQDVVTTEPTTQPEFPPGSWEDEVISVDTMEKDEDGHIFAYLVWRAGRRTRHRSQVVNQKCPQKMLIFYEAHLQFKPPRDNGNQSDPDANGNGTRMEELDEEDGIKPVASALAAAASKA